MVAANKQDSKDAWETEDLRIALRLEEHVKIIPCVAMNRNDVKNVLLELLYIILAEMDAEEAR